MSRINLIFNSSEEALVRMMQRIRGEELVDDAFGDSGVEGVVRRRLSDLAPEVSGHTLDLIAHSSNGVLQFGDWKLDEQEPTGEILRDRWAPLKPGSIRLLGCITADTQAGQRAMRHLAEIFHVPIFGATVPLQLSDFDEAGLTADAEGKLVEIDGLLPADAPIPVPGPPPVQGPIPIVPPNPHPMAPVPPRAAPRPGDAQPLGDDSPPREAPTFIDTSVPAEPPVSDEQVERWFRSFDPVTSTDAQRVFDRLRAETLDEATRDVQRTRPQYRWPVKRFAAEDRQRLFAQLNPELATAPGLLAVPDSHRPESEFEALFPVERSIDGPRFFRATILLGARFVRIYPIDVPDGVILRSPRVVRLDGGVVVPLPPWPESTNFKRTTST